MAFSLKLPSETEPALWGAAAGAAALAFIGFLFAGWVTGGKAAEIARQQSDKAVIAALAPICVDKFRRAKDVDENTGKLMAISLGWEKGTYISQGGWATLPGNSEPHSGVAQACAELLNNVAKQ
jgi:hypothetical protein